MQKNSYLKSASGLWHINIKSSEKSAALVLSTDQDKNDSHQNLISLRLERTHKKQVDIPKPEAWKINQERKREFHTVLLYGCLAMPRLALIITDPLLLFRSSQLLLLPWKPLIWIGVKPALIADPYHHQAHHPSNSVCSLRFVNWLLCFASLNWCLESGSLSLSSKKLPSNQMEI